MLSCEKEEIVDEPEQINDNNNINLKLERAQCAYDSISNIFYFPVSSDTIQEYIALINHSLSAKAVYLNGTKIVNNSYNDLGTIYVNRPYELRVEYSEEEYLKYELVFTTLPIIQIFTSSEIVNEPKIMAKIKINNPYYLIDNELSREIESSIGIELRGGTAQHYPKLSYAFELWGDTYSEELKDIPLLGMRQDDDWILDGMYNDKMRMRNRISFDIWNSIAKLYYADKEPEAICGIRGKFVEVFINNEYKGLYCLNEKLDRKQLKIKKYDNTIRGVLYKGKEWETGATTYYSYADTTSDFMWDGWEQEYPKPDEKILWAPIYNLVKFIVDSDDNEFENNIDQYIDLENAVSYYIFLNIIKGLDNRGKNTFLARYDKEDVFFYIPWDMDGTWGRNWDSSILDYSGILTNNMFDRLLATNTSNFKSELKEKWELLKENELKFENIISRFEIYTNNFTESGAIDRENRRWEDAGINLEEELILIESWLENRINYLDNYFNDL
jgi:spore coat protein H